MPTLPDLGTVAQACLLLVFVPLVGGAIFCFCCLFSAAVAALLQSPLVTSNAGVAEAALRAVQNLAGDKSNSAKLGAAGVCEGGYPA